MTEREWTILAIGIFVGANVGFILSTIVAAGMEQERAVARSLRTLRREDDLERAYRENADAIEFYDEHGQLVHPYQERIHEA